MSDRQRDSRRTVIWILLLSAAVLGAFWPILSNGFVNYDDDVYVTANPHIQEGLTLPGLKWAWSAEYASNWHPLTWMSHMLDMELFGDDPSGHHATSLILHLANTLLLFLLLRRMTGSIWRSATAAALFGLHPLHVESVAWIAERKDVLGGTFWLLTTLAYARYARSSGVLSYWLSILLLAAGLCCKPMLVTLPFTLLLLDYWPLGRWAERDTFPWHLIREKVPMLILVAASCAVTLHAQMAGGAVQAFREVALATRIANAAMSYVNYLWKMLWPVDLAVFYPHPVDSVRPSSVALATVLLVVFTFMAIRTRSRRPYISTGWFWYLGTLLPVIGLVQVGSQAMADRYTYIPLIGIFVILAWGVPEALNCLPEAGKKESRSGRMPGVLLLAAFWLLAVPVMMAATRYQAASWRSSTTLFTHALDVTENNTIAHHNLGNALLESGDIEEAIQHFEEAIAIDPEFALSHNSLCFALNRLGMYEDAVDSCTEAIKHRPEYAEAWNNRSLALAKLRNLQEAADGFSEALRLREDYAEAHNNFGATLRKMGRTEEAITHLERAIELDPEYAEAFNTLGMIALESGRAQEAIRYCTRALELHPEYLEALCNLGGAYTMNGLPDEALQHLDTALRLNPGYGKAYSNRAAALYLKGDYPAALKALESARLFGFEPPRQLVDLLEADL